MQIASLHLAQNEMEWQNKQRKQTEKKKKKNENKLKCILNWQSVLNSTENEMKLDRRHVACSSSHV